MLRGFYLMALVAFVLSTTSASAQVKLKFKFPDGRETISEAQVKSSQTMTLAGNELVTGADQTLTFTTTNGTRAADGTLTIKSKVDAVKAAVQLPFGTELEFDSTKPDADPPGTQFDFVLEIFKATAKSAWESTLNQDNRVVAIKGRDAAFADLPENLRDAMKAQLDAEYLKVTANDELDKLPSQAVSVGDSWERTNTVRLDSGQRLTFTNKYTYKGSVKQDGKQLEQIASETTDIDYSVEANAPFKVLESDLKVASSAGEILFDNAEGHVVSQRSKTQIKGTLKLEVAGKELPGDLDLTLENSVKIK